MDPKASLLKARESLSFASYVYKDGYAAQAGRAAYMAAFHAARAFIELRTGKTPKTHSGTRVEFSRLVHTEPSIDRLYSEFLNRAYEMKTFADYTSSERITMADAELAMTEAARFVDLVTALAS